MSLINDALKRANQAQKNRTTNGPLGVPLQPVQPLRRPRRKSRLLIGGLALVIFVGGVWSFGVWWGSRKAGPGVPGPGEMANLEGPAGSGATEPPPPVEDGGIGASEVAVESAEAAPVPERHEASVSAGGVRPVGGGQPPVATPEPRVAVMPKQPESEVDLPAAPVASDALEKGSAAIATVPATSVEPPAPEPIPVATDPSTAEAARDPEPAPVISTPAAPSEPVRSSPPFSTPPASPRPAPGEASGPDFSTLRLQGIFYRIKDPSVLLNRRTLYEGDEMDGFRVIEIRRQSVVMEKDGQRGTITMR